MNPPDTGCTHTHLTYVFYHCLLVTVVVAAAAVAAAAVVVVAAAAVVDVLQECWRQQEGQG